ncbi:MAG TPA: PPC domain-containing protein [Pirellulales bacterium]|nr:PPC domain-containing protein [Pirellulales bacterium]
MNRLARAEASVGQSSADRTLGHLLAGRAIRRLRARGWILFAFVAALASLAAGEVCAQQLPKPRLLAVFPCGARQGTSVEIEAVGDELLDVTRLYCSHPGITAEKLPPADGKPLRFKVNVAPEVPLGYYDLRLVTRLGASNPRTFVVGDLPEVSEQEPNNQQAQAMRVELGTVINGRCLPAEDVDLFVFSAKAGERVLIECRSKRIDSNLDGFLWLYDASGRQLVTNQDDPSRSEKTDPLIDVTIPADGDYFVKLADFVYGGGNHCFYRLAISTLPQIDFVLPTGAKVGEERQITLYGRNLPGGEKTDLEIAGRPLEKITRPVTLPAEAADTLPVNQFEALRAYAASLNGSAISVSNATGRSNAKLLVASNLPEVLEQEPNNTQAEAQRLTAPVAVSGQFSPAKDADYFTFSAKKGEIYTIDVIAQRIGSPADADMEVLNSKGAVIATPPDIGESIGQLRFPSRNQDIAYELKVPEDGDYTFRVEHLYGQVQGGPQFTYRVELAKQSGDFQLVAAPLAENRRDSDVIRQGGRERLDILVFRLRGHNAPIVVTADKLPPGVTCEPLTIGPGMKSGTLILTAAVDAPVGESEIHIVGKSQVEEADVERVCRGGVVVIDSTNTPCVNRMTRSIVLSVRENSPFRVTATAEKTELKQGEPLTVACHVDRRPEVNVDIQLNGRGFALPTGIDVPLSKVAAGQADGKVTITTDKVPPGTYSIAINGEGQVPFERKSGQKDTIRCVLPSNLITFTILPKDAK